MAELSDPFEEFARANDLQIVRTPLNAAPRDLVASPDELESYTLVELQRDGRGCDLRVLFLSDQSAEDAAGLRDVLWWLASDAWAIERAERDPAKWREILRHPADSDAGVRLFALHLTQTERLSDLLGADAYRDLLARYTAQLQRP